MQYADSAEDLANWQGDYTYNVARTLPAYQLEDDYETTEIIPPMCVFTLIDLRNMRVFDSNCGQCSDQLAEGCIEEFLAQL